MPNMAKTANDIAKVMFSREALPFYLWLDMQETQALWRETFLTVRV